MSKHASAGIQPGKPGGGAALRARNRSPLAAGGVTARRPRARFASLVTPLFVSLGSLGLPHAEAGILHAGPPSDPVPFATLGDRALKPMELDRRAKIEGYADGFGIPWSLAARIYDAAVNEGVSPELAFRLVRVESSFRQWAVGPAGSIGYTQVQPRTATWLDPKVTREDLFEVETNLRLGFGYLRMLLDRYRDTRLALLAYNRGPGTVEGLLAAGEDPENGYAERVLSVRTRPAR